MPINTNLPESIYDISHLRIKKWWSPMKDESTAKKPESVIIANLNPIKSIG